MARSSDSLVLLTVSGVIFKLLIPAEVEARLRAVISNAFRRITCRGTFTVVIQEKERLRLNYMYEACHVYLSGRISDHTYAVRVSKTALDAEALAVTVGTEEDEVIRDSHGGIGFTWIRTSYARINRVGAKQRCFQLSVDRAHRDYTLNVYLPYICRKAKEMKAAKKSVVKLYTVRSGDENSRPFWTYAEANHPATFGTVAMEPEVKARLVMDLDLFVKRKEYYRKVGRAWKRGYILYGPPGTGKSSLVAAMANYLKFDIYDLDLKAVRNNAHLRNLLLSARDHSIIVIEDIDCSVVSLNRKDSDDRGSSTNADNEKITLSGLLNLIDGLWSCCREERIIVFTTNHKERLDPALLRPGRMDVQLEMSYCKFPAFKILASNYLNVDDHPLFPGIEELLDKFQATPAQIAGELMKNNHDVNAALINVTRLLTDKGFTPNI